MLPTLADSPITVIAFGRPLNKWIFYTTQFMAIRWLRTLTFGAISVLPSGRGGKPNSACMLVYARYDCRQYVGHLIEKTTRTYLIDTNIN